MSVIELKQLHETSRQIAKAMDGGDPPSTVMNLLQPLEKWKATEEALRQTRIGVHVARVRQINDPKVASLASQLVNKWKMDVNRKPKAPGPATAATSKIANGSARSATSSPAPKKEAVAPPPKKFNVPPEKRSAAADGVDTKVTGDPARDGSVQLIYNGLAYMSEESPDDILAVAKQVEAAALEFYKDANKNYKEKMRALFLNLKGKQSGTLRRNVFSGAIQPEKFVQMTSEELKSEDKKKEDEELEKENMKKAMTAQEEKAISKTMQCGKCKKYAVAYSQAQTRSADEPMTVFCECTLCGNRWKFS